MGPAFLVSVAHSQLKLFLKADFQLPRSTNNNELEGLMIYHWGKPMHFDYIFRLVALIFNFRFIMCLSVFVKKLTATFNFFSTISGSVFRLEKCCCNGSAFARSLPNFLVSERYIDQFLLFEAGVG